MTVRVGELKAFSQVCVLTCLCIWWDMTSKSHSGVNVGVKNRGNEQFCMLACVQAVRMVHWACLCHRELRLDASAQGQYCALGKRDQIPLEYQRQQGHANPCCPELPVPSHYYCRFLWFSWSGGFVLELRNCCSSLSCFRTVCPLLLKINVHIYHLVPADSKDAEEKLSKRLTINNVEENEPSKD